ncbi:uncharacterized protein TNCV_294951 [Trichonephila clavipes]|nr:uncharacterized protein TNCV_294951 [Trichonephila clavipes]
MPARRRRNHYQQLTEFERGRVDYEKADFLPTILQKDLAGMYPLSIIVWSSGQGMVMHQENRVSRNPRGSTEREARSIGRTTVTHCTASAAVI